MPNEKSENIESWQILRKQAEEKAEIIESEKPTVVNPDDMQQLVHKLRVHQIELEMQNDELQKAHFEEKKIRARYFELYDMAPVGYLTITKNGLITESNLTAADLLQISRKELFNKFLSKFVYFEDQDVYYLHQKRLFDTGKPQTCEIRMVRKNTPFWVKIESTITNNSEEGPMCWSILIDIDKSKLNEIKIVEKEEILKQLNIRYELADEIGNIGIWEWDIEADNIIWNNEMFKIYGIEKNNKGVITYEQWRSTIHPDDIDAAQSSLNSTLSNKTKTFFNFRIIRPDKTIRYIQTIQDIVLNCDKEVIKVIGVNIDTTEKKEWEIKCENARISAEKASKAKSDFLSNMSHEIRTPLNGIIGFTELLIDIETDEEKKGMLHIIESSSEHLLCVINDILSLAKIESGKMQLYNHYLDFHKFIQNTELLFTQQAKLHNLNFLLEYNKDIPQYFMADETPLLQILTNLIGNSIKFTKKGYIKLIIKDLTPIENINKIIEFSVIDTGIGINEEKQKRLYEPFEQGEYYLSKTYGGSGLGLAIVRSLIDLMSGSISVTTEIGKGTKIVFSVPMKCAEEIKNIKYEKTHLETGRKIKIISAEDNKMNQRLIEMIAQKEEWDLKKVSNGKELLEELEKDTYDIVLMDIQMPILNGLDATKLIRENKKYDTLPIIGISAYVLEEEIENALKTGMNAYLSKPFKAENLKSIILSNIHVK